MAGALMIGLVLCCGLGLLLGALILLVLILDERWQRWRDEIGAVDWDDWMK